jgi:hypothetical protein
MKLLDDDIAEDAVRPATVAYHAQQQLHVPALITPYGDRTLPN